MYPTAIGTTLYVPRPWKQATGLYAITALFCALLAAVLTLAAPETASLRIYGRWLFIIECVGMIGVTCGTLISRMPWLRRHRPLVAHGFINLMTVPTGYILGSSFAYTILDEPIPIFQHDVRRILALTVTTLASLFVVYLDELRHRYARETAARSEAQRLAVESQLRLLRAQLEPHMLFNTLANLRSLVEVDPRMAQTMIDQLIVYLRSTLAASREQSTTLRHEFAQLKAYLEIMSLRMGPRLTYRLELPDSLQRTAIPPMLLQPLVENAIKHGLEPKIGSGTVEVIANQTDGAIEISVTDSGLGLPADEDPDAVTASSTASYGLAHVRERLLAFYGSRASLRLQNHPPQGVQATVRIPL